MQRIKLLLILGVSNICAALVLAQTSPVEQAERGIRPHPDGMKHSATSSGDASLRPEVRVFYLNNVQYWARISEEALLSGPDWVASKPLPLDFATAEAVARHELRKLISDDATWEVTGFHLRSVRVSASQIDDPHPQVKNALKWYFQVEMRPVSGHRPEGAGDHSDSFWVFIDLSGRAGKIEAHL